LNHTTPPIASHAEALRRAIYPPVIAMIVLVGLLGLIVATLLAAARAVEHSDTVIARATDVLLLAVDAETGQRGYLIAGDRDFLDPYSQAEQEITGAFAALENSVADDPTQAERTRAVREAYTRWLENARREMAARQQAGAIGSEGYRAWLARFNQEQGKTLMDEVRRQSGALINHEKMRRGERERTVRETVRTTVAGGVLVAILLGCLLALTTRRQMTSLSQQYEGALNEEERARGELSATLYGIGDAVLATDARGIVTAMNPIAEQLTGWTEAEARGKSAKEVFDIVNETTRQPVESPVDNVLRDGRIVGLANHTVLRRRDGSEVAIDDSGAPVKDAEGNLVGVVLVFRDVTERRQAESALAQALRRETLVNQVGAAIRNSPLDAEAILQAAVTALGQGIGADRCYYGRYDQAVDFARLSPEWHRDDLTPIAGDYPMSRFSINRDPDYKKGQPQVVEDVRQFAPPGTSEAEPGPLEALGLRALIRVPLQIGNEMTTLAVAMADRPRRWTESEISIVETVATQVQSALEAARLLAEERRRAVREGVLRRIDVAIRASLPPAEVQAVAVEALGQALGVERCYFAVIDEYRDSVVIGRDWTAGGVPSFAGEYRLSQFAVDVKEVFGGSKTLVVADTQSESAPWGVPSQTAAVLAGMQVRAMINVPFHEEDRLVAALGVAMANTTREWTAEDIALTEAVATETREAVEAARARQWEHNIAVQLQEALVPTLPDTMPGLALRGHYRAALAEAGVGGDFSDVFAIQDENQTCLVVADLSGKGLAAASQVATVRNMLRYALHADSSLSAAITRLNRVLVEQNLLASFATLFVGRYDARTGVFTYVNCGQEPGLIWRMATGTVEQLPPTGPVLGGFAAAEFHEASVTLASGDLLALFTDGLTETGPTRRRLLGIGGAADLFAAACQQSGEDAEKVGAVLTHLVTGADTFSRGVVWDDLCLVVARVLRFDSLPG
jgi:PAS domain S-box-containing protein